jgi:transcriptional regulator with XRE-family HTH domain
LEILAKRLKELRETNGITQEALALELGLSGKSSIANYESGLRNPDYDTLIKITKYFGVTTDYLLGTSDKR